MRKWAWVLVVAMVAILLLAGGAGALGQPDASKPALKSLPPPKAYAYHNGKVIIGGDVVVPCRMFPSKEFSSDATTDESQAQLARVLEQCEQAGYVTLPGTGGGSSTLLAAGMLLLCAGLGLVAIRPPS